MTTGPNAHWGFKKDEPAPAYRLVTASPSSTAHEHRHGGHTLRHSHDGGRVPHGYYEHPEDGAPANASRADRLSAELIELAYQHGHAAAMADAQACKTAANGTTKWHSREHTVPADADERAAWMRGYGRQFVYWGGAKDEWEGDGR